MADRAQGGGKLYAWRVTGGGKANFVQNAEVGRYLRTHVTALTEEKKKIN